MPSELPKLERLMELRRTWAHPDIGDPEQVALLDAAIALRRLEEWLRGSRIKRECILGMGDSSMWVELTNEQEYVSVQNDPSMIAALTAALDQAEKEGK